MLFKTYQKKKFLLVDDFDNFIFSLKQMLRRLGAEDIDSARNGEDAVQLFLRKHYDVVFCDYNMGEHKNGQQVLEELRFRKLLKNTDIFLLVSAEAAKDMVFGALECQPDGYITKPITQSILQNRLDKLMEQKEATADINRAIDLEDYSKAITLCNQHLKANTKYRSWTVKTLANLYYLSGDLVHSKQIYEDILQKRRLDWARLGLGKVLLAEGNAQEAAVKFEELIEEQPLLVEAYDWLAKAQRHIGHGKKAQGTLQQAVEISPRALLRQKELAEISRSLHDLETASKAYRQTNKLSEYSCHESPDLYLDFTRCLSDLSEGDTSSQGQKLASEANAALDRIRRKYKDDPATQLKSHMVEARVWSGQGKAQEGAKALKQAQTYFDEAAKDNPDLALEMAQTLYALNQEKEAEQLLTELAAKYPDNEKLQDRIEELRDEPVSLKQRIKARELNRKGIQLYEEGALSDGVAVFKEAMAITPAHVGLNLNLLQTLIKSASQSKLNAEYQGLAQQCLSRLQRLTPQHRQYKRYQHLLQRYQQIQRG
ncbi:tetratricopeptide repeat-containing response regulator [Hahella sp. HN01]|uniref:tetratricopeptide repeat-containing response regulator n=1 Tax=Hahella sp. HN01 TaxID=2847262 RepID=UPI001C1ED662|nr:tetratricopeptide repeat-containing response regulator [Hahella sp. HN01]MBU6955670.1 response regulator [Hahella sp. HN01]